MELKYVQIILCIDYVIYFITVEFILLLVLVINVCYNKKRNMVDAQKNPKNFGLLKLTMTCPQIP